MWLNTHASRRLPPALILADRARMPWRFLARHVTVDELCG